MVCHNNENIYKEKKSNDLLFYVIWYCVCDILMTVRRCLEEVKRNDDETRRKRIEYAEKWLQRLKAGPKQLESAYKLGQIFREQEQQRRERLKRKELECQRDLIEGQQLMQQAVKWIENRKEQIRNYEKRCAQYKEMLKNDIKEREEKKLETKQQLAELEEKRLQKNTKQMQKVLKKEQKNANERRTDRQNADFLSKHNMQQRRQSNVAAINHFSEICIPFSVIFFYCSFQRTC